MVNQEIVIKTNSIIAAIESLADALRKDTEITPHYSSRPAHLRVIKKLEIAQEVLSL